jgi:hypothetical protein
MSRKIRQSELKELLMEADRFCGKLSIVRHKKLLSSPHKIKQLPYYMLEIRDECIEHLVEPFEKIKSFNTIEEATQYATTNLIGFYDNYKESWTHDFIDEGFTEESTNSIHVYMLENEYILHSHECNDHIMIDRRYTSLSIEMQEFIGFRKFKELNIVKFNHKEDAFRLYDIVEPKDMKNIEHFSLIKESVENIVKLNPIKCFSYSTGGGLRSYFSFTIINNPLFN